MRLKLLRMTNSENRYEFEEYERSLIGTRYYFVSTGERDILKVVEYKYAGLKENKIIYNLGFGTYNQNRDTLQDDDISANGDTYKVFNTVLSTIPNFIINYPRALIMVAGSDSTIGYPDMCRSNCIKKCLPPECKNAHRRINIYKNFVNKNFSILSREYKFWGSLKTFDYQNSFEEYKIPNHYKAVFFQKIM